MIKIELPNHFEQHLQSDWADDLSHKAVEGYSAGVLSLGEVAEMLNLSINDANGFLKDRGIFAFEDIEEIEAESLTLEAILTK